MIIYAILNLKTDKYYIGQTINWERRKRKHKNVLKGNRHYNQHLQLSWNKYGESSFFFFVLEECNSIKELNKKEEYWIEEVQSMFNYNGYNLRRGGENYEVSIETREKMSKNHRYNKKVYQYDLNGKYIESYYNAKQAAKKTNVSYSNILKCLQRSSNNLTADNFIWVYNKNKVPDILYKLKSINHPHCKKVYQYDLDGNYIQSFQSIGEASRKLNLCSTTISRCLKDKYPEKRSGKFQFRKKKKPKIKKYKIERPSKEIFSINPKNNIKTKYNSITEAAENLGVTKTAICNALTGKTKRSCGLFWHYK